MPSWSSRARCRRAMPQRRPCSATPTASSPGRRWRPFFRRCSPTAPRRRAASSAVAAAVRADVPQCFVWQFQRRDGVPVDLLVQLDADAQGPDRVRLRLKDLSSLQCADRALEATEARLRQVLDNTSAVVFIKDRHGRYFYVNQRFCEMFGRTEGELIGGCDADVFPPKVAARLRADDQRVMERRAPRDRGTPDRRRPALHLPRDQVSADRCAGPAVRDLRHRHRHHPPQAQRGGVAQRGAGGVDCRGPSAVPGAHPLPGDHAGCGMLLHRRSAPPRPARTCARSRSTPTAATRSNIEYDLPGTVCGTVVGRNFRLVADGRARAVPRRPHVQAAVHRELRGLSAERLARACAGAHRRAVAAPARRPRADGIDAARSSPPAPPPRSSAAGRRTRAACPRRAIAPSSRPTEDAIFVHDWDTGAIVDVNPKACEHVRLLLRGDQGIRVGDISSGVHPYVEEEALRLINEAKRASRCASSGIAGTATAACTGTRCA